MKFIRTVLAFVVAFTGTSVWATDVPRLWKVTGKNEQGESGTFYILPVTHNGLAVEYDDYLQKVVLPIALKADVLLHESSRLIPAEAPTCSEPLPDTVENREILRTAYADVERAAFDLVPTIPDLPGFPPSTRQQLEQVLRFSARERTKGLSEYGLIMAMEMYLTSTQLQYPKRLPTPDADYVSRPTIAEYIEGERLKNGSGKCESVDEKFDLTYAFCNMGARRAKYLKRQIELLDPTKFVYPSKEEIAMANKGFVHSLSTGFLSEFFPIKQDEGRNNIVCDRNEKWLIQMKKNIASGVRFYALGIAHVVQLPSNASSQCAGLLAQLESAGFSVSLVK